MKIGLALVPLVTILALWEGASRLSPTYSFLIGSPLEVIYQLGTVLTHTERWYDLALTGSAASLGLLLGTVTGSLVGVALALFPQLQPIIRGYLIVLGGIPILALAPLLTLWCGIGWTTKVVIAALGTFLLSLQLAHTGATESARLYAHHLTIIRPPKHRLITQLLLPGAFLWVVEGAQAGISIAILGVFIGESINSQAGIGHMIIRASSLYRVNEVWCGVVMLTVLTLVMHAVTARLIRTFGPYGRSPKEERSH